MKSTPKEAKKIMGLWDTIKRGYSRVDRAVGGYLPGGSTPSEVKSGSSGSSSSGTSSSTSSGTSSSGSSSSGTSSSGSSSSSRSSSGRSSSGSSAISALTGGSSGTYDIASQTYTDASGNKYSMSLANAQKQGATIILGSSSGGSSGRSSSSSSALGNTITPSSSSQSSINFDTDRKTVTEYGILTVTPEEAKSLKGKAVPYWEVQSTSPSEAIQEGLFVGSIEQKNRNINTQGLYEYNLQNILAGKSVYNQYKNIVTEFEANPESFKGRVGVRGTSTAEGEVLELTPEYFQNNIDVSSIYKNSKVDARNAFNALPKSERTKLKLAGYGVGVSSAVIGIGEFAGTIGLNMGVQTFTEEDLKKMENRTTTQRILGGRKFTFGEDTILREIRTYPTTQPTVTFGEDAKGWLKQKATSPEFLGQATVVVPLAYQGIKSVVGNIKNFGWAGGTAETLSGFSPLRIRSGVYSEPLTSNTKFNVDSVKYTDTKGITNRIYTGTSSSGNIKIYGFEKSALINGQRIGGGYTYTSTPYLEIRGGGSIVNYGTRTTVNPYSFGSSGSGTSYLAKDFGFFSQITSPSIKGSTSDIITSRGVTIYQSNTGQNIIESNLGSYYKYTGGSSSNKLNSFVENFASGRAKAIYSYEQSGTDFIYKPSGRYKLNPTIAGREYDLNSIINSIGSNRVYSGGSSSSGSSGGAKLISKKVLGDQNIVVPEISTPQLNIPKVVIPPQTLQTPKVQESIYAGTGLYERTNAQTLIAPKVDTSINTDLIQSNFNIAVPEVATRTGSRSRSKSKTALISIPKVDTLPAIKQGQNSLQVPRQRNVVRVKQIQRNTLASVGLDLNFGGGSSGFNYSVPTGAPIPIPNINLAGFRDKLSIGNVGGRIQTAYTPSFTALFYKLRGKKKNNKTGLDFRPITPDFSYSRNLKKVKRLIKIRI